DSVAFDEFHHEVRHSVVGSAAVEQACDIGMIQSGEYLALMEESLHNKSRAQTDAHQLDGDLLVELAVDANGPVDVAHAAVSDLVDNFVWTDSVPDPRGDRRVIAHRLHEIGGGPTHEVSSGLRLRFQQ